MGPNQVEFWLKWGKTKKEIKENRGTKLKKKKKREVITENPNSPAQEGRGMAKEEDQSFKDQLLKIWGLSRTNISLKCDGF